MESRSKAILNWLKSARIISARCSKKSNLVLRWAEKHINDWICVD